MNKQEKLEALSATLGVSLPEELTVAQLDAISAAIGKDQSAEVAQLESALESEKAKVTTLTNQAAQLAKALEEAEQSPVVISDKPIVKIGNESYKVLAGTRVNGNVYTAAEIAADKTLAKSLIDRGSGVLQKI